MNTAPPSSSSAKKSNYVSIDDMENATLLPRKDDSMIGKKNQSNVSLKNVAYGLGIVALACSGSFVAGRSAAQYKLSAGTSQLGVAPRLGGGSKASVKHSTAHRAAAAKKARKAAKVGEAEDKASVEDTQPADPDTMSKEEMAEEIKQLRGYMTSLVGDDDAEVKRFARFVSFSNSWVISQVSNSSKVGTAGSKEERHFRALLFDDDSSSIRLLSLFVVDYSRKSFVFSFFNDLTTTTEGKEEEVLEEEVVYVRDGGGRAD